jgi:hypothetical protein
MFTDLYSDEHHLPNLLEECLLLLINIVTETPPSPVENPTERAAIMAEREIIHHLAGS